MPEVERAIKDSGFRITELVSGCAPGVDRLGEEWAKKNGIPVQHFPADWDKCGKKAGPIRNAQMAAYANALIFVWDGQSPGTSNMIDEAFKRHLPTYGLQWIQIGNLAGEWEEFREPYEE